MKAKENSRPGCYGRQASRLEFVPTGQRPVCPDRRDTCLPSHSIHLCNLS